MAARSTYYQALDGPAKVRYNKILQCIDDIDPYTISLRSWKEDPHSLPQISYPDIVNFLVYTPSPYTLEDLKCYKGLDAYNQFVSGWVRNVVSTVINGKHVVTAKVMHSQRLREAALKPWLIAEKCGKIIATHCNCIAGLGEACTHVSALMFYIDTKMQRISADNYPREGRQCRKGNKSTIIQQEMVSFSIRPHHCIKDEECLQD
ncbi:uncharacterized protein LOC119725695 isoform X2 [Patiria miniata]|uniref:SWIM-type domain-containing protein n=1 Tax=Patiria miniata TaxID=46514 RepID=A0A913Z1X1_PATMI|nr:uncharacterized protein LOC119719594 isoform X2 [Patiria miniata]XP_038053150.1 uncharacterized protein LOC119725695 isoform X2 [Patiria miniata]